MVSTSFRRKTVLLLLVAVLATPWASASSPSAEPGPAKVHGRTGQDLLSRTLGFLASLWSKTGCRIDPNGHCLPESAPPLSTPQADTGCQIDPDGRCRF